MIHLSDGIGDALRALLSEAGVAADNLAPLTSAEEEALRAREREEVAAVLRRGAAADLRVRGVDERHAELLVSGVGLDLSTRPMRAAARFLEVDWMRLLFLLGPKGRGKSLASAWLAWRRGGLVVHAEHLVPVVFASQDEATPRGLREADLLRTPLLAIDDLGLEGEGRRAHTAAIVARLVRARCGAGTRTVITTNMIDDPARAKAEGFDPDAPGATWMRLWDYFGDHAEHVAERLTEYGVAPFCGGPNLRARARAERNKRT